MKTKVLKKAEIKRNWYVVDATDPFPNGYTIGDIWGSQQD